MFSWFFLGLGAFCLFLAGAYLDPVFTLFAVLLAGIPLSSLLVLLLHVVQLRYSQDYQTTHPEKGTVFAYTLRIRNETPLRIFHCKIHFLLGLEGLEGSLRDFDMNLGPGEIKLFSFEISCPYRGMYQVGASGVSIRDSLGITSYTLKLKPEVFYVYPVISTVNAPSGFDSTSSRIIGLSDAGLEPDTSLMSGIQAYRPGMDTRMLLRRRFLETGQIWLKEHETVNPPGILVGIDLRREKKLDALILDLEDRIFESVISLLAAAVRKGIPAWILYWNHHWCIESLSNEKDLGSFMARSMQIQYADIPGLEEWYFPKDGDQAAPQFQGVATHLFTHRWNPALMELLSRNIPGFMLRVWTEMLNEQACKSLRDESEHFPDAITMIQDRQGKPVW